MQHIMMYKKCTCRYLRNSIFVCTYNVHVHVVTMYVLTVVNVEAIQFIIVTMCVPIQASVGDLSHTVAQIADNPGV